jgi:sigma-E factor negative regulatory protein RseB
MFKRRNSLPLGDRFAWGLFAFLVSAIAAAADDPREWLERMNHALTASDYDGTFSHWQDGKVEMLRIIHRVKNGEVRERLVSLDGSGREFIRTGTELACYLPDKKTVLVEKRSEQNPLLGNFPTFDEASTQFYDIQEVKRTRFNRRNTRIIAVTPKDEFRYGYRLWIDDSTAMPIRTQLCDAKGKIIEQVVFSDLTFNARIPDTAFKPEVSTEGFAWLRNDAPTTPLMASGAPALWNALKLPPGFALTARAAQVMPGSPDPVAHLVYSDGMASVSVFVEVQTSRTQGAAGQTTGQPQTGVARVGSSSAFSTVIEGHKVTVVGEVPPETVKSIANSVTFSTSGSGSNSGSGLSLRPPPPRR